MKMYFIPIQGRFVNAAWKMQVYGHTETLFRRCNRYGKVKSPIGDRTAVYRAPEIIHMMENDPGRVRIFWDK